MDQIDPIEATQVRAPDNNRPGAKGFRPRLNSWKDPWADPGSQDSNRYVIWRGFYFITRSGYQFSKRALRLC